MAFPFLRVFYEPPCDRRVLGEMKTFGLKIPWGKYFPKPALCKNKTHAK
jgi:hypothetical protein